MSKKVKKIKQKTKKYWKNKLVKSFELYIRYRDNWTCITCGAYYPNDTYMMHAGHLISRKHENTQFDEQNVFAQCRDCNCSHTYNPQIYTSKYIKLFGEQQYHDLVNKSRGISLLKASDMEEMYNLYQEKLNAFKSQPDCANRVLTLKLISDNYFYKNFDKIMSYVDSHIFFHHCMHCKKVCDIEKDQDDNNNWFKVPEDFLEKMDKHNMHVSTGICPQCLVMKEIEHKINGRTLNR